MGRFAETGEQFFAGQRLQLFTGSRVDICNVHTIA
jgi:hypothetical protein